MSDFDALDDEEINALLAAAREVTECQRVLAKTGDTILSMLLGTAATASHDLAHYPPGDVYDAEFHAQYYFHAHPPVTQPAGEVGHFHTFLRPLGMPEGITPLPAARPAPDPDGNSALSHLIGVAVDGLGRPVRLFTTNRWVTGETWYDAASVSRMLEGFLIDHARPSWPLNRWLTALVRLYRQPILDLLQERDAQITAFQQENPGCFVFEERSLEVLSEQRVDLAARITAVEQAALERRRARRAARAFDAA